MEIIHPAGSPEEAPIEQPSLPGIEKEEVPFNEPAPLPLVSVSPPAGFIRRAVAFMIDFFIIELLYLFLLGMGIWGMQLSKGGGGDFFPSEPVLASLAAPFITVWFFLFLGYFTFFHSYDGQTPAKMIIRIKVAAETGSPPSVFQSLLRSFGYFISGFFFGFGFFFSIFERKKRALHDLLVGTQVVLS